VSNLAKIEEIYHAALQTPASERAEYLIKSCGNDEALRREVESLLSFDEQAADFIETRRKTSPQHFLLEKRTPI